MLAILAAALTAAAGCNLRPAPVTPDTHVQRGERYETGSTIYDEYFKTVHELHSLVEMGRLEERDARASLAQMLGLLPTAESNHVLEKLYSKLPALPKMKLKVDDESHLATIEYASEKPQEDDKGLVQVIEATASAELKLAQRMLELAERAERMKGMARTLTESAPSDFASAPPEKQQEVTQELQASNELLTNIAIRAKEIASRSRSFALDMQAHIDMASGTANAKDPGTKATAPKPPTDFNP